MAFKAVDPFTEWLHHCSQAHSLVWSECCTSSLDLSIPFPCGGYLQQWGFVLLVWAWEKRVWNKSTHGLHMHCVSQDPVWMCVCVSMCMNVCIVCVCVHVIHVCYVCVCERVYMCVLYVCVHICVCFQLVRTFLGNEWPFRLMHFSKLLKGAVYVDVNSYVAINCFLKILSHVLSFYPWCLLFHIF